MRITRDKVSGFSYGYGLTFIKYLSFWGVICAACVVGPMCDVLSAQNYLTTTGLSSSTLPYPAEMGTVDAANGNLHLEIPLGSFPQRGGSTLVPKLIYDSHIWTVPTDGTSYVWTPQGALYGLAFETWGFDEGGATGVYEMASEGSPLGCDIDFMLWSNAGAQHYFNIPGTLSDGQCTGGNAYAADSSGFQIRQTPWNVSEDATISIYAPDGTQVYGTDLYTNAIAAEDSNGNYLGQTAATITPPGIFNPVIDTLGRTVVAVPSTENPVNLQVMNSTGSVSNYQVTFANIPVKTDFGQQGVSECNDDCVVMVITSIMLPDTTSYAFLYDCDETTGNTACNSPGGQSAYYGTLTSMTLPTGGIVTYYYSNFEDGLGAVGHWLVQKSSTPSGPTGYSGYETWNYAPTAVGETGLQVTVTRPDTSTEVTSLTIDGSGSVWPTQILSYDIGGITLLSTVNNTWDFSNPCKLIICTDAEIVGLANGDLVPAHQDVRKLITLTTLPVPGGSITKKTQYTYDAAQTGNVTGIEEWKYQSGTSPTFASVPDRGTYTTYATIGSNNNINRPTSITVCNNSGTSSYCNGGAGGSPIAQTVIAYDGYGGTDVLALQDVPTASNHDDTHFGTSYLTRGNATQINQWVAGNASLATYLSYDTTGQIIQAYDSHLNKTTYSYMDRFYDDNGDDPPAAHSGAPTTNAYLTEVTDVIGSTLTGFYYGSGQPAWATDYDGDYTYAHYVDPFDRPTKTDYPIGWAFNVYGVPSNGQTEIDSYVAVGDTGGTGSASCTLCAHSQALLDAFGRAVTGSLVNNPSPPGTPTVNSIYDGLNRVVASSHPNFGVTDPNDVFESAIYDGLGRSVAIVHPGSESSHTAYGAGVVAAGGLSTQTGSTSLYGVGFPVLATDEAGKPRQEWLDGFGRVIEVDEPSVSNSATPGSGSFVISGGPMTEGGPEALIATVNGYTVDVTVPYGATDASIASAVAIAFNSDQSPVTAGVYGETTVYLTAKVVGANTNYTISGGHDCPRPCVGLVVATPSGTTLTGGSGTLGSLTSPAATYYTYDVLGNLTGVTQGAQSRSYQYDALSRLTQETTPEAGTVTLSYTTTSGALCSGNPSNPCSRTAPAPNQTGTATVTTTYTYDTANRLTKKTHSDTTGTITYTYKTASPGIGSLASMTDPSGSEVYQYDKLKRVTNISKKVGSTSYGISYSYNSASQLTKITYPSGRAVGYNYDDVGHLCQVATTVSSNCNATTPYLTLLSSNYDAVGRPLSATYGNGVAATVAYNQNTFQLTSLSYAKGTATLLGLNYYYVSTPTYCPTGNAAGDNGQIQCITDVSSGTGDSGRSVAYTYDQLGRLLTANTAGSTQYPAWGLSWVYDRYGNRTNQNVTKGSGYTSSLQPNSVNNRITSPAFTYDAAGNVIAVPSPLTPASYTYDGEECNTGFTGSGSAATYTCDGNHLRVEKVVTGTDAVTTVSIRSGGQVIAEYDNGAAVTSPTREYLYGNNLLAIVTGSTSGSGGTIVYQQRDLLAPRLYTDVNGNCVGDQGTYPFGELWYSNNDSNCSNATSTPWVFTSYERDQESGDDYTLARSYANGQGRFLAPDPLEGVVGDPQSWNRYAYVENDPINLSDPSGQGFWEDLGFAIADIFVAIFAPEALEALGVAEDAQLAQQDAQWIQEALAAGLFVVGTTHHGVHADTTVWACGGGPCSQGGQSGSNPGNSGSDGGAAPQGNGSPGGPADNGAGGAGAGGNGTASAGSGSPGPGGGGTWDEESPVPGSRLPNGDVAVGIDLFRNSSRCSTCGTIIHSAYGWGQATTAALAVVSTGALASELVEGAGMMEVAIGPGDPIHVAYGVEGQWFHATGELGSRMVIEGGKEAALQARYLAIHGLRLSIPVLFPQAVLATEGNTAWWCVGAALSAVRRGWVGF